MSEKKKELVGRPTVVTEEVLQKLESSYSLGCSDLEACVFAGISKSTLYKYLDEHPEFSERRELLKEKQVLKARSVIAEAINNKDKEIAKWYLERKKKLEFSARIENTGANGEPLAPPIINITAIDPTKNE